MNSKKIFVNSVLILIGCLIIFYYINQLGFQNLINKINDAGWKLAILLIKTGLAVKEVSVA